MGQKLGLAHLVSLLRVSWAWNLGVGQQAVTGRLKGESIPRLIQVVGRTPPPPFFLVVGLRFLFVNCQLGQHLAAISPFLVCVSLRFRASERSTNPSQAGKTLCLFFFFSFPHFSFLLPLFSSYTTSLSLQREKVLCFMVSCGKLGTILDNRG